MGRDFVGRVVADGDHQLTESHVLARGEVPQLMGIGRAADEAEQRRGVRVRELAFGKAPDATQADRDQAGAQRVRHRLAQPEVGGQRQGGYQLRETKAVTRSRFHEAIVGLSPGRWWRSASSTAASRTTAGAHLG